MAPEVAALLGVIVGAAISGLVAFFVNERSQRAEDKRLQKTLVAERERLNLQAQDTVEREQREAARGARRERLRPALELLDDVERVVGANMESQMLDTLRARVETQFGKIDEREWREVKSTIRKNQPPSLTALIGEYTPKLEQIPLPDLVVELKELLVAALSASGMNNHQRMLLLGRIRSARDRIDAEAVRGEWP